MPFRLLVYGFGNPGRADDGLGPAFAEVTGRSAGLPVRVETAYQLNAEDSLLLLESDAVIFADASRELKAGFFFRRLLPSQTIAFTTHAMDPASVSALCLELYGRCPACYILEMAGRDWEMREGLSSEGRKTLEDAFTFLKPLLENPSLEALEKAAQDA